jgi:hypothetical protein
MTERQVSGEIPSVMFIAQLGTGGDSWRPVSARLTAAGPVVT